MNGATSSLINSMTSWTTVRKQRSFTIHGDLTNIYCTRSAIDWGTKWKTIRLIIIMHQTIRASKNWGIWFQWKSMKILFMIVTESSKEAARKKTHNNDTYTNVSSQNMKIVNQLSGILFKIGLHALWTARPAPCIAPQKTNFHAAPCHNPPISMVKKLFKYVRNVPFLLPPRGIYT